MKVFISYGHDDYAPLVYKISDDLKKSGLDVWIDKDIKKGSKWDGSLENKLLDCDWVLVFMTQHAVRRPNGYCLDEIAYARMENKNICPFLVEPVKPPLSLVRIQYFDLLKFKPNTSKKDTKYQKLIKQIIDVVENNKEIPIDQDSIYFLSNKLDPIDNAHLIQSNVNFYGRKWLFEAYKKWLNNKKSKVFCVLGGAGSGKTAFISNLCESDKNINAIHFCKWNSPERSNPINIIKSLAFHLSTQVDEYRDILIQLDLDKVLQTNSPTTLFETLFIKPLFKIHLKEPIVMIIDALDEATNNDGENEVLDLIVNEFKQTPDWLRLVVTSRPESNIKRKMTELNPVVIDYNSDDNINDIRGYLNKNLKKSPRDKRKENIDKIIKKSEGNFLYVKLVLEALDNGQLDINNVDKFPNGLINVYLKNFERLFKKQSKLDYKKVIPLMEVLVAEYGPISNDILADILEIDEYDFNDICEHLSKLFPIKNDCIVPIHKSLIDWLTDKAKSGTFYVNKRNGHNKLAKYFINRKLNTYSIKYLYYHCLLSKNFPMAVEVLADQDILKEQAKIANTASAISNYIKKLSFLQIYDNELAINFMSSEAFFNILIKYKEFFTHYQLYYDLQKINFDSVVSKLDIYKCNLELISCLMNYLAANINKQNINKMTNIVEKIKFDENNLVLYSEIINIYCSCLIKLGFINSAIDELTKVIKYFDLSKKHDDNVLFGLGLLYITLGDALFYKLKFMESIKLYDDTLKLFGTLIESTNDMKFKYMISNTCTNVCARICINYWWQLMLKESNHWQYQMLTWSETTSIYEPNESNESLPETDHTPFFCLVFGDPLNGLKPNDDEYLIHDSYYDKLICLMATNEDKAYLEFYFALARYIEGNIKDAKKHIDLGYKVAIENTSTIWYNLIVVLYNKIYPKKPLSFGSNLSKETSEWISYIDKTIDKLAKQLK